MPGYSAKQMKMLHGLAAKAGLTHEDLRTVCGVEQSLTELDCDRMSAAIRKLREDRPRPAVAARRAYHGPKQPGPIMKAASDAQRALIDTLIEETLALGEPQHVIEGKLWSDHRYRRGCAMGTFTASKIFNALKDWKSNLLRSQLATRNSALSTHPEPIPF